MTNRRLLCRFASGRLKSLWWSGVVGLQVDPAAEHVVLDYGDGQPVNLLGAEVAPLAVVGIASVYGPEAMLTHPAFDPAMDENPATPDVDLGSVLRGGRA